jgi:hypothetical protein
MTEKSNLISAPSLADFVQAYGRQTGQARYREYLQAGFGNDHAARAAERLAKTPAKLQAAAICLADVKAQPVEWLWPRYIPRGMITLLDGDPDRGKSFITLDLAARASRGWKMPPDTGEGAEPAGVLLLNAEDDPARTLRPRLEAMGADLGRVHILPDVPTGNVRRPPVLPDDLDAIEALTQQHKAALVVIDPLMAFLTGKVDSHKDSDIRRVMHGLKELAERTQAAVVIVRHLNKLIAIAEPLYRGGGSIGIIGAARSALLVARDPDDPLGTGRTKILARSKGNLCPEPPALAYTIEPAGECARVAWLGVRDVTAGDLLAKLAAKRGPQAEQRNLAKDFLQAALERGPIDVAKVEAMAKDKGIAESTLKRAKRELGVVVKPTAFGGPWQWALPRRDSASVCQVSETQSNLAQTGETAEKQGPAPVCAKFQSMAKTESGDGPELLASDPVIDALDRGELHLADPIKPPAEPPKEQKCKPRQSPDPGLPLEGSAA